MDDAWLNEDPAEVETVRMHLNNAGYLHGIKGRRAKLTRGERLMLECIARRQGVVERKSLYEALRPTFSEMADGSLEPDIAIVDVVLCKLRKRLHQVTGVVGTLVVKSQHGVGFYLDRPAYHIELQGPSGHATTVSGADWDRVANLAFDLEVSEDEAFRRVVERGLKEMEAESWDF